MFEDTIVQFMVREYGGILALGYVMYRRQVIMADAIQDLARHTEGVDSQEIEEEIEGAKTPFPISD